MQKSFPRPGKFFLIAERQRARVPAGRWGSEAGFTLTELMIVLAVISIVAILAFIGIRENQRAGAYARFTDDLVGTLTRARNLAIDDQTTVRVQVEADRVQVFWTDPESTQEQFIWGSYRDRVDAGLLTDVACITGLVAGIRPPSEPAAVALPGDCLGGARDLEFGPDGGFVLLDDPLEDAGVTLVVRDASSEQVYYSFIEVFPGGLIRKFDGVPAS